MFGSEKASHYTELRHGANLSLARESSCHRLVSIRVPSAASSRDLPLPLHVSLVLHTRPTAPTSSSPLSFCRVAPPFFLRNAGHSDITNRLRPVSIKVERPQTSISSSPGRRRIYKVCERHGGSGVGRGRCFVFGVEPVGLLLCCAARVAGYGALRLVCWARRGVGGHAGPEAYFQSSEHPALGESSADTAAWGRCWEDFSVTCWEYLCLVLLSVDVSGGCDGSFVLVYTGCAPSIEADRAW